MSKLNLSLILEEDNKIVDLSLIKPEESTRADADVGPINFVTSFFKKERYEDFIILKNYKPWIINRFIASYQNYNKEHEFIHIADMLNREVNLNNEPLLHYDFLFNVLPKKSKVYCKYIFNKSDKFNEENSELIKALKWKNFPLYNNRGAEQALVILSESEKEQVYKEYKSYLKRIGK